MRKVFLPQHVTSESPARQKYTYVYYLSFHVTNMHRDSASSPDNTDFSPWGIRR
jgi:hypothetical protein